MQHKAERVGVIVAHADDECLGMGGTIPLLDDVHILILTQDRGSRIEKSTANVRTQSYRAAEVLGSSLPTYPNIHFDDNALSSYRLLDIIQVIEGWLSEICPDTVYTHSAADLNVDHRLVLQAVLTATRPQRGCFAEEIYSFEVPSSTEWAFGRCGPAFQPNIFVDITRTLENKLAALACYDTEMRPYPHPRSPEALQARAQYWGSVSGLRAAEAFELVRAIIR